jgi:hypothetical protein
VASSVGFACHRPLILSCAATAEYPWRVGILRLREDFTSTKFSLRSG